MHKSIIISSIVLLLLVSCNLDQVTSRYESFEEAKSKGLFDKGWIPEKILFESMSDIFLQTNLDRNTCIFSFKLNSEDYFSLKETLGLVIYREDLAKLGVDLPNWWLENTSLIEDIYTVPPNDLVFLKVDDNNYNVYGWFLD